MISEKMRNTLNDQIQAEFASAYMYLGMSIALSEQNLDGMASWMKIQYEEEREHAQKIIDFLIERGGKVELKDIETAGSDFGSPLQIFEKSLAHEKHVTALIHNLYALALEEKDYATQIFLQWFITEQVEEEDTFGAVVEKMKQIPENSAALFYFDKALGKREDD